MIGMSADRPWGADTNSWGVAGAIGVLGFRHPFTRRMSALVQRNERLPVRVDSRRAVLMYATAAAVLILAAASFGASSGIGQEPDKASSGKTAPADEALVPTDETPQATQPISQIIDLGPGITKPAVDMAVTAAHEGRIVQLHAQPGQAVEKDELLATMANSELEQALGEATQNVKILEQSVDSDVNLEDAMNSSEMAAVTLEKARKLRDSGGMPESEFQKAVLEETRSKLRVRLANTQKLKQRMELQRDTLALEKLQERIERLQIRSPSHGIVESVDVSQGQSVHQGKQLFRVVALDQIRVSFHVPGGKIFPPNLLGQMVTAKVGSSDGQGGSLTGKVSFVSSEVDMRNETSAWAICDNVRRNGHWAIRAGMRVHVTAGVTVKPADEPAGTMLPLDDGIQEQLDDFKQQEVDYLKELIVAQESAAERARIQIENGTGTFQQEASARRDVWRSKAELLIVLGQHDEVAAAYQKAIDFAQEAELALGREFEVGRVSAYEKLRASRIKTQINLDFLRYQRTRVQQLVESS